MRGSLLVVICGVLFSALLVYLPSWYLSRDMGNTGLWLAFALIRWLRWGWECYASGGLWRSVRRLGSMEGRFLLGGYLTILLWLMFSNVLAASGTPMGIGIALCLAQGFCLTAARPPAGATGQNAFRLQPAPARTWLRAGA